MSEQTYYCDVCGFEGEGVKPAFCPFCDFALRNDAPFESNEDEWARTIKYAEEHAAEFATPNPNYPLPLEPYDIEMLRMQHMARTIDWACERIFGRNTP